MNKTSAKMDVPRARQVNKMSIILYASFVVVFCLHFKETLGQSECNSPSNVDGFCVAITQCPKLLGLLKSKNRTQAQTKLLRDSQCGEVIINKKKHPKVCCPDECGVDASGDRIIGGEIAGIDQFPWMGIIEYKTKKNTIQLSCGATLINDRFVVTAAHCVYPQYTIQIGTPINIRLGEFDKRTGMDCIQLTGDEDCNEEPNTIKIDNIIIHPDYNPSSGQGNDIALIKLAEPAPYTDFIRPICLPRSDVTVTNNAARMSVAGWGTTESGKSSDVKRFVVMTMTPIDQCQSSYGSSLSDTITEKQICAGGDRGKDSCRGDSGGPMMAENNLKWTLHGVVSFGPTPCATEGIPGVYTKVFSYIPWIRETMEKSG